MAAIFPVTFIASNAANTIGLAGKGEVRLIAEDIELAVVKPWPVAARVGLFFVAVPVLWFLFGSLTSAISGVGGVWSWLRVFLWLFTVFGVPLCVLGLIGHYCVKGNVLDAPPKGCAANSSSIKPRCRFSSSSCHRRGNWFICTPPMKARPPRSSVESPQTCRRFRRDSNSILAP